MRVLCLAAHPDDEVLGVGGTLLKHKDAGDEVTVALVYECRPASLYESQDAEERMGIEYLRLFGTPGGAILDDIVQGMDTVYIHSSADLHHEHQELVQRALVACRPQSGVRNLYAFETPSATDWGPRPFIPQRFVDITSTERAKAHVMEAYGSELRDLPHPRNTDALEARAQYWGQRAGVIYAEAFEVIRECA